MYKKLSLFLCCFITFASFANDHCTNPKEYTVDKRCYVTDAQKKTKPYNAVVGLVGDRGNYCTGTIIEDSGELYVITASHCTTNRDNDFNVTPQQSINIVTQNGAQMKSYCRYYGTGVDDKGINDWALYSIDLALQNIPLPAQNIPYVKKSELSEVPEHAIQIGYGALRIMSDKEIRAFKEEYKNKLLNVIYDQYYSDSDIKADDYYGFTEDGGVSVFTKDFHLTNFIDVMNDLMEDFHLVNDNNNLKMSQCISSSCQIWHGDSGSGVFDKNGNIIEISISGLDQIGGKRHAKSLARTVVADRTNFFKNPYIKECTEIKE